MFQGQAVKIKPVRLAAWRPRPLGQLVTLNPTISPNIQVEVQTGLDQYILPIGLMGGGVALFVLGTALEKKMRPVTTIAGLALVASGVGVTVYRSWKKSSAAPAPAPAAPAAPPPPSGGIPVGTDAASTPAFQPPSADAFNSLQIQIVSPGPDQSIGSTGGFLFLGTKKIPVQLRMYNPSSEAVTFNLDFVWDEMPGFTGYDRGQYHGTSSFQVTLGPGEEKNQTFELPIQTDVTWTQIQTALAIYKKRTPLENEQLLSNITFTVT
jgi:hypothetical protein